MKPKELLKLLREIIYSREILVRARTSEKYFTRERKMSFSKLLTMQLDLQKTTIQTRLNSFLGRNGNEMMSEQAFSKARNHYDHSPFETMVRTLVETEYNTLAQQPTWNGYFVLAVDGTYLQLPKTEELRDEFGTRGGGGYCVSAGVSVLYDVLSGWPLDPILTHTDMNERTECEKHMDYLVKRLPKVASKSLILLDRGYPSKEMFAKMDANGIKYVARCSDTYCKKTQSAPIGETVMELEKGLTVRVYKFVLPSGEVETLLSNAIDISCESFPPLYAMRWGIETAYNTLKNKVALENFSGRTANAIRQDFWSAMVLMISIAVFEKAANGEIKEKQQGKANKHKYKVRTSDMVVTLRDRFIFETFFGNSAESEKKLEEIISLLAYSKSPVRPDRHFARRPVPNCSANLYLKSHL